MKMWMIEINIDNNTGDNVERPCNTSDQKGETNVFFDHMFFSATGKSSTIQTSAALEEWPFLNMELPSNSTETE
jgi:hypothetical protein